MIRKKKRIGAWALKELGREYSILVKRAYSLMPEEGEDLALGLRIESGEGEAAWTLMMNNMDYLAFVAIRARGNGGECLREVMGVVLLRALELTQNYCGSRGVPYTAYLESWLCHNARESLMRGRHVASPRTVRRMIADSVPLGGLFLGTKVELRDDMLVGDDFELLGVSCVNLIKSAILLLTPKQGEVLRLIYGIDCEPLSCKEISVALKLSTQRVYQLHASGLKAARKILKSRELY
jgi:DNA-directed RNA polymerase specialized sigma24 family protein